MRKKKIRRLKLRRKEFIVFLGSTGKIEWKVISGSVKVHTVDIREEKSEEKTFGEDGAHKRVL